MDEERRAEEHKKILLEAVQETQQGKPPSNNPDHRILYLGAGLIALLMILWVIPTYAVPKTIEPKNIPTLQEVLPNNITLPQRPQSNNIGAYIRNSDPTIKVVTARIVTQSCSRAEPHCYAKSIYRFVRDNINYLNDPVGEYYELPQETLLAAAADCDGQAILAASMLQTVGIQTRFAYKPNHVYVQAWLPKTGFFAAENTYEWINIDPTCKDCRIGELRARPN